MGNVVHHPAFSGEAVINGRHRGAYPKEVTSLRIYKRDQRSRTESASVETAEQQLAEANRVLGEVSHHLVMAARAIARQSKT